MASTVGVNYSLVIPVYRNEGSIAALVSICQDLNRDLHGNLEVVFVVDGSPDRSFEALRASLPGASFRSQLILLSRNFGSIAAVRAGLSHAQGKYFAVMAADLQEPPELILQFFRILEGGDADVTIGTRTGRSDPLATRLFAGIFWRLYRLLVQRDIPPGGVDVFGCNRVFREALLGMRESHTSLVGLLFWLGYRRKSVEYQRLPRVHGRSSWTFARKLRYLSDSIFSFTDLPIRLLTYAGLAGICISAVVGTIVFLGKIAGLISVPGYAATVITIVLFAALNSFGLGIVGSYVWRAFENTKQRPESLVIHHTEQEGISREA